MVRTRSAGISAIAFSLLTVAALVLVSPPGGNYSAGDVTSFTASGHRPLVVLGLYAALAASLALLGLVLHLRTTVSPGWRQVLVLGGGGLGVVALPIGFALSATVPIGLSAGGGAAIDPRTTYMFSQAGLAVVYGVALAGTGLALLGAAGAMRGWLRIATYVGGAGGVLSLAWFPSWLLLLWGLVAGAAMLRPGTEAPPASSVPRQGGNERRAEQGRLTDGRTPEDAVKC